MISLSGFQKTRSLQTPPVFGEVPEAELGHSQPLPQKDPRTGYLASWTCIGCFAYCCETVLSHLHTFTLAEPSGWTVPDHHWFGFPEVCNSHVYSSDNGLSVSLLGPRTCSRSQTQKRVGTANEYPSLCSYHLEEGQFLPGSGIPGPRFFIFSPCRDPYRHPVSILIYSPNSI